MNSFKLYIIGGLLACNSAFGGEPEKVAQTRNLNASLLQLHQAIQDADASEAPALRERAAAVIERRAARLAALIEENPAAALSMAFSPELLADLAAKFPDSAARIERQDTVEGPAEVWVEDNPDGWHRSYLKVNTGGESLRVYFDGAQPEIKCGNSVRVAGIRLATSMAATAANATVFS